MIILILFCISIFYLLLNKLTSSKHKPTLPPGPTTLPYIGCLISLLRNQPTFEWIHRVMDEMNTKILCVPIGNVHLIIVSDPDIALEFLKDKDGIFSSRPDTMVTYLISDGYLETVFSPMGDQWKKMRKMLTREILSVARHKWHLEKRNEEHDNILRYINNQCKTNDGVTVRGLVNVRLIVQQYTTNIFRKLIFGNRYFGNGSKDGGPGKEEIEYADALWTVLFCIRVFCLSDYFPWLRWITDFEGNEKRVRNAIQNARKYQDSFIDERIQQWKDGVRTEQDDLLDVLINLEIENTPLSADEIKAEILDLYLAGFDNASNNMEWAMAEILNQPRILNKAVHELDTVVGKDRLVQESDMRNLNYIKCCVKEAFRLHPVAPFNVPHLTTVNATVAGYFIPKGSHVLVSRLGLGRNLNVWDDPLSFNPDRHINGDKEVMINDHNLHMFSFGIGPRGCPAVPLGSTMPIMLLARLLQCFTWELPPNEPNVDLKEMSGSTLKAKPLFAVAKPRLPHLCL